MTGIRFTKSSFARGQWMFVGFWIGLGFFQAVLAVAVTVSLLLEAVHWVRTR